MFNQLGQSRGSHPTPRSYSRSATPSSQPVPSAHSAQYRPDFLKKQAASPQPTQNTAPASSYKRARAALADPLHYGAPLTERQQIAIAMQQRTDPRGVRDAQNTRERIYGKPSDSLQPRNNLTRYSGPSRRYGL